MWIVLLLMDLDTKNDNEVCLQGSDLKIFNCR